MKKAILLILMLVPILGFSQKIKKNNINVDTGERLIETSWEALSEGDGNENFYFRFLFDKGGMSLEIKWGCQEFCTIERSSEIKFMLSNRRVRIVQAISYVRSGVGNAAKGSSCKNIEGINPRYGGDFRFLGSDQIRVVGFRIDTNQGHHEFKVEEKHAQKLSKSFRLMVDTLRK